MAPDRSIPTRLPNSTATQGGHLTETIPSIKKTSDPVQEIASASEELAATAEEMGGQAQQLQELMTFFRLADSGQSAVRKVANAFRTP